MVTDYAMANVVRDQRQDLCSRIIGHRKKTPLPGLLNMPTVQPGTLSCLPQPSPGDR
jgi:hypothetical protein